MAGLSHAFLVINKHYRRYIFTRTFKTKPRVIFYNLYTCQLWDNLLSDGFTRGSISKLLRSPEIDSKESIAPAL
jgi:hypothetical protein